MYQQNSKFYQIVMLFFLFCILALLTSSSLCDLPTHIEEGLIKLWEDGYFSNYQQDLEARVAKLEELIKIGTLRSCAEYSQYGLKNDDYYLIDPDGPLLGQPPFRVFCNFTAGPSVEDNINFDLYFFFRLY